MNQGASAPSPRQPPTRPVCDVKSWNWELLPFEARVGDQEGWKRSVRAGFGPFSLRPPRDNGVSLERGRRGASFEMGMKGVGEGEGEGEWGFASLSPNMHYLPNGI